MATWPYFELVAKRFRVEMNRDVLTRHISKNYSSSTSHLPRLTINSNGKKQDIFEQRAADPLILALKNKFKEKCIFFVGGGGGGNI